MRCVKYLAIFVSVLLSGCSNVVNQGFAPMALQTAWFEGSEIHYITTDVSDREMAKLMNANFAPRLSDAVPQYPKPPYVKTVLERVYKFKNGEQTRSVFPSIPNPIGFESEDRSYSPLWLVYFVEWVDKKHVRELRSEREIYEAEAMGWVTITRTDIVANCPVVLPSGQSALLNN